MLVYSQEVKEQKREREREKGNLFSSLFLSHLLFLCFFFSVLLSYSPPFIVTPLSGYFLKSCVGYQCFAQYVSEIAGLQNNLAIVILYYTLHYKKAPVNIIQYIS